MKSGDIRYMKFSGYSDNFDECKDKNKSLEEQKRILNCLTKKWEITNGEDAEYDPYKLNIYEGNSKAWYLLILRPTYITFGLARQ